MKYIGSKALDAEIELDMEKGNVRMDYSLNRFGSPLESSRSCVIESDWRKSPVKTRIWYALLECTLTLMIIPMCVVMPTVTGLSEFGYLKPDAQYRYQKFLRWFFEHTRGIYEQSRSGTLKENILSFTIPHNIWFEYRMEGDYRDNLKKVSLKRNFVNHKRHGIFHEKRQRGWNVIFEFSSVPQAGNCTLRYV